MYTLGKLQLSTPLILAPMAGITSFPYRMFNRMFGCECAFTEMIDVCSLVYSSRKTLEMLYTVPQERPLGIQLLGKEPVFILKALEQLQNSKFDILDFNAACPQRKVTSKGEGASLLKNPQKLQQLLKLIVKHTPIPLVTVKIRLGWETLVSARDIALYVQDAGVQAIFVHGRTRAQGYSGRVNYQAIREIKKNLQIPVIASGDIFTPQLVRKMFEETGCDAVTVARGALGNPWIFRETVEFLKNGTIPARTGIDEIIRTMKIHLDLDVDFFGEKTGVLRFRKFYIWYTRGFSGVKNLRNKVSNVKTKDEMLRLIEEFHTKTGVFREDMKSEAVKT